MINMPDAELAREAEICYASVVMVTDFNCWHQAYDAVTVQDIIKVLTDSAERAKKLMARLARDFSRKHGPCQIGSDRALDTALIMAPEARDPELLKKLDAVASGRRAVTDTLQATGEGQRNGSGLICLNGNAPLPAAASPAKEIGVMPDNIEVTEQAKKECATALNKVLADTFVLYLKTHGFHWNVEGPQFISLHAMFEEQYKDLWAAIDEIAERIRALGQPAPGSAGQFLELAEIRENGARLAAKEMLGELVRDNETAARTMRTALPAMQSAGDEASADVLIDRLAYHEKQIWMMKSVLVS